MPKQVFNKISEDRKVKLLKSSIKEFTKRPYDKITVASLTDTMKILRTDFYYYFYDKEDIYQALIDRFEKIVHKIKSDATIKDALNILFEKTAKLEGTRNKQYLIDITDNYHPQFAYELVERLNKIFVCNCTGDKPKAKHLLIIYRFMSLVNLYAKKEISFETAKELLNE